MHRARTLVMTLLGVLTFGLVFAGAPAAQAAGTLVPISGAGSTWSANAIDQWRRNVNQFGLRVNFQSTGSSDGRNQFKNGTVDYGVSEIPYGVTDNGVMDAPPQRSFAYMPIVAGGTSFMYNLKVGGKRLTNLRLSGDVLTKIFTKAISSWNDPAIAADNPGVALPARPIVPVVRSDGSGTTAQFTLWMKTQYPDLWKTGQTSNFPRSGNMLALAGSLGVAGYVSQDKNEGTITYVEYSYALNTHFPVVKLLNKAGYYVGPTASNVAIALQGAAINADLTQKLEGVYNHPDKRAYPMSSYSYMIVPTKIEAPLNENKGYTLGEFANYFLCEGQNSAGDLGYSPLPKNLVQAGLDVVKKIPGAVPKAISACKNNTFAGNSPLNNAPQPPECDKKGGPASCTGGTTTGTTTGKGSTTGSTTGGTTGTTTGGTTAGTGTTTGTGSGTGTTTGTGTTDGTGTTTGTTDGTGSTTGITDGSATSTGDGTGSTTGTNDFSGDPTAQSGNLTGGTGSGYSTVLVFFAGMLFAGLIIGPPLAARRLNAQQPPGDDQ